MENDNMRVLGDAAMAQQLNVVHHAYVDISGDLIAGMLLGQVLYWFGNGKDGKPRARIYKDGHLWIAKARTDWHAEIRISPKQYDRASKILRDRGFIEVHTYKFAGNPTTHIRIVPEAIAAALDEWKAQQANPISTDGGKPDATGFNPMGNNELAATVKTISPNGESQHHPMVDNVMAETVTSLTENTAENNLEITSENTHTNVSASVLAHAHTTAIIDNDFLEAWSHHPKKEGRAPARRAFEKAVRGIGTRKADGTPYTGAEIIAAVVLYKQHAERLIADGMEYRYIPTGGKWFSGECWADEYPSISSSLEYDEGARYNRNAAALRRAASADDRGMMQRLIAEMPY